MRYLKFALVLLSCSLFFYSYSQTATSTPGKKGSFGVGLNPLIGLTTNTTEGNNTTSKSVTSLVGVLGTGTFNITDQIFVTAGIGTRSEKTTTENSNSLNSNTSSSEDVTSGLVFQAGFFNSFPIAKIKRGPLGLGIGLVYVGTIGEIESTSTFNGTTNSNKDDFISNLFSVGIRPEWFATEHISIYAQVGVALSLLDEGDSAFTEGGVQFGLFKADDLLGQAGFTFWF